MEAREFEHPKGHKVLVKPATEIDLAEAKADAKRRYGVSIASLETLFPDANLGRGPGEGFNEFFCCLAPRVCTKLWKKGDDGELREAKASDREIALRSTITLAVWVGLKAFELKAEIEKEWAVDSGN